MPRRLATEELNSLSKRSGVKEMVVQRFFAQMDLETSREDHVMDAVLDSFSIYWNHLTLRTMLDGLDLMYETEAPGAYENRPKGERGRLVGER